MNAARALRPLAAVLTVMAASLLLLGAGARPALAHASLLETSPFDGEQVAEAPEQVSFTFNEAVTSTTGALRIFDGAGERIDTGVQTHPEPATLTVGLPDRVPDGSYVATYRVTSADGHVIRGALVFSVGDGAQVDDATLASIFAGGGDTAVAVLAGVVRAVGYGGALLLGGAVLWSLAVARGRHRDEERSRAGAWARRGAGLAALAAVAAVPVQAVLTSGMGLEALTSGRVLSETLGAPVGLAALVRLVAAATAVGLLGRGAGAHRAAVVPTLVVLGSFLVDGHTRTGDPAWLLLLGDTIHLLTAAAWFGGLVMLAGAVRARRFDDDPVGAADVVGRFSRVATWSIVAVTLAGSAMSWALVRQPRALTSTDYGWTLLVKVALVAVVVVVGAYNNRRLVPAITSAAAPAGGADDVATAAGATGTDADRRVRVGRTAWAQLRATARFEVAVLVAVLAVTAFMVNLRPAAEEAGITGAFDTLVAVPQTDLQLNLVVDPNRVGHNEIHFYVLDETGRPVSDLEDVQVRLTQPTRDIGPIVREPAVAGPGHWLVDGNDLGVPGEWVVELVAATDRFTQRRVEVPVVVNP